MAGRKLPHALVMLIPQAWEDNCAISEELRAFYRYHACLMEPWDGPAAIAFTDGTLVGGVLDRNGLRPARYWVTRDDVVVMASEAGILDVPPEQICLSKKLGPGQMFLVDTKQQQILSDQQIKSALAVRKPYRHWVNNNLREMEAKTVHKATALSHAPDRLTRSSEQESDNQVSAHPDNLLFLMKAFGYTREDLNMVIKPMAEDGEEPVGSMGNDTPLAILSRKPRLIYDYFRQLFAQVTNPPIDPIREETVMSLASYLGRRKNLLAETAQHCRKLYVRYPILTDAELNHIKHLRMAGLRTKVISTLYRAGNIHPLATGEPQSCHTRNFVAALDRVCEKSYAALKKGYTILVLSDRGVAPEWAPLPALLAVGAVHQFLVRRAVRSQVSLIVDTGEAWEVHHFATLFGYGAGCINPYLAYQVVSYLVAEKMLKVNAEQALTNYRRALLKGILKVLSKMGISTLQSYRGAQTFEAIGLAREVIDRCFQGTTSRVAGAGWTVLAREAFLRHQSSRDKGPDCLPCGGFYQWKKNGEFHLWNPLTIPLLQQACQTNSYEKYAEFARFINDQREQPCTLRSLLSFSRKNPIPLSRVEPAEKILPRFVAGAMSYGAISPEAHETIALAMNRLGGKSNTGEGGEDPARFVPLPNGDSKKSAIKQVASGRFGVTTNYLVNAEEIQIKIAQGAKPGEGGQLPGHKVTELIARTRCTTPGVTLISPPPHHDIYSIEDLAQLIYDLKRVNPTARISVKLASEIGVGTVAAGVAKAGAQMILISGGDGGTGASPLSSIRYAGSPWELGLAETHQTLILHNLRHKVKLQVDGQMRTGRDVAIAALLGADEYGFCSSLLVVLGCVMLRHCHLNECVLGIATQEERFRKNFRGKPEHIINYFHFVTRELREIMADLGMRSLEEMVGRTEFLELNKTVLPWKAKKIDLSRLLHRPQSRVYCHIARDGKANCHPEEIDDKIIREVTNLRRGQRQRISLKISNSDRAAGAKLSGYLTRLFGETGLPEDSLWCHFRGTAGQSFGAFLSRGITFELEGFANDYVGKSLSGGKLIIYPDKKTTYRAEDNIIAGNTCFYGATSGEAYLCGQAGERFCVRNSGATAVVEGVGDHGLEYMTGGKVLVLGPVGRNFAAGMSGGLAFVYDRNGDFSSRCNQNMVALEEVNEDDATDIQHLLSQHCRYTGSPLARKILDNMRKEIGKFIKVVPLEYRQILRNRTSVRTGLTIRINNQSFQCLGCGTPFCHWACPAGNLIPEWQALHSRGLLRQAGRLLLATHSFPEITGRICPALCEYACVQNKIDCTAKIQATELEIAETLFARGLVRPELPEHRTGKKVAIVGSGPAGLAAAHLLNRFGHEILVLERDDMPGGLLRYGIPDFKLEKHVLERRLALLKKEGVKFATGVNVDAAVLQELCRDFHAVCLAGGCRVPRDLHIPGRQLKGIHFALEFLTQFNWLAAGKTIPEEKRINVSQKKVVIVGGGDTGADCVQACLRQGALRVFQLELLPKPSRKRETAYPWPVYPRILKEEPSDSRVKQLWSVITREFIGEKGRVTKVRCAAVDFVARDNPAGREMREIPGSEFEIESDLVILALGFLTPETNQLLRDSPVKVDLRGYIQT
ncbi:MAG TPA: glutamate synthase large subunit, partial [bacterium]|nr:glutamate synthase large subunit [bacterium]